MMKHKMRNWNDFGIKKKPGENKITTFNWMVCCKKKRNLLLPTWSIHSHLKLIRQAQTTYAHTSHTYMLAYAHKSYYSSAIRSNTHWTLRFFFVILHSYINLYFHFGFWIYFHSLIVPFIYTLNKLIAIKSTNQLPIEVTTSFVYELNRKDFPNCSNIWRLSHLLLIVVFASCLLFYFENCNNIIIL